MKRVDPNIKIMGVGMYLAPYWKQVEYDDYRKWNTKALKDCRQHSDYVLVHRYYFMKAGEPEGFNKENYLNLLAYPIHLERNHHDIIGAINMAMIIKKDEPIKISFNEWHLGTQTLAHALATARFLNVPTAV
jgi:alpha-L-arabinofuranosidase